MPYPAGLFRFNIEAGAPGGDIMVHTVWMRRDDTVIGPDNLAALTDKVRETWAFTMGGGTGLPAPLAPLISSGVEYRKVTGYKVDALGKATDQAEALFTPTVKGSSATNPLPPQVALCVTLLTNRPGRSGRGRIFLGGFGAGTLTANGRMTLAARDTVRDALAGFYTRLRNSTGTGDAYRPVVVSRTLTDSFKITDIAVGDVFDTMRSRRNALVEAKATGVVDAS